MEKRLITTAHNQYYTIYTWIFETFFTVKFFLFFAQGVFEGVALILLVSFARQI